MSSGRAERRLVSKNEILDSVWADSFVGESNLSRHIYLLRRVLSRYGAADDLIENVARRGYRFTGEVTGGTIPGPTIRVERHLLTETVIEESEEPEGSPNLSRKSLAAAVARYRARPAVALIVCLGILSVFGLAFFYFARVPNDRVDGIGSVAVLPFRNADAPVGDRSGLLFADSLITQLSGIRDLKVRPTSAVAAFSQENPDGFGRELGVDAVLEGTIFRSPTKVVVSVQLVRLDSRSTVWAGRFESATEDELRLHDEIALQVVDALALKLSGSERELLTKRYSNNADAFRSYLKGRSSWNKRSNADLSEAEYHFRSAIAADPDFALAYVGLADTIGMRSDAGEAFKSVRKAIELDPNLAEAYATLGFLDTFHSWKWEAAEQSFRRSIQLKPGYATAHHWYASLLAIEGRFEEAKAEMHRALEIDPLSYNLLADLGQIHYFAREYDLAEEYCRRALKIYPNFGFAHGYLFEIYLKQGRFEEAVEESLLADVIQFRFPESNGQRSAEADAYIQTGRSAFVNGGIDAYLSWLLEHNATDASSDYGYAINRLRLGDTEGSLAHLQKAAKNRAFMVAFVNADPVFDPVRNDPRYRDIVKNIGLEPSKF